MTAPANAAFCAPRRLLLGPGPSPVPDSVLRALAQPTLGHLDPVFLGLMDELRGQLACLLGAKSGLATPISATGSAGMETVLVNLLEPGDRALIGVAGVFGTRMAEVARRAGAEVDTVEVPYGRPLDVAELAERAARREYRVLAVVHGETSTGVLQPLDGLRSAADAAGALLVVDAVTSLAGCPLDVEAAGIDALYSGTQKCLSCPPGLAPVWISERARERVAGRSRPSQSWYLDLALLEGYWGGERAYHHTAPINMLYGLHEALRLVFEEGLDARYARHLSHARALWAGLGALGLEPCVEEEHRLPPLTSVRIPGGIEDGPIRKGLLERFGIEIGGGLGPWKGSAWRIGLMGAGSTRSNVWLVLSALETLLAEHGHRTADDPLAAAAAVLG